MGKHTRRKLNQQQQRRVHQRRHSQALSAQERANARPGQVITNFGKRVMVEDNEGQQHNCAIRQNLGKLVAGDRVLWQETGVDHEG
ncbi:MAG TPA: ribosome small subunit-dependent GTPase A, partial [Piscirickettsiaceae bacterium]|nr:ribosome small subunit-dependent GTPase A [Piscirickettsiaceae bacterium]